jgi:hypothetical protein
MKILLVLALLVPSAAFADENAPPGWLIDTHAGPSGFVSLTQYDLEGSPRLGLGVGLSALKFVGANLALGANLDSQFTWLKNRNTTHYISLGLQVSFGQKIRVSFALGPTLVVATIPQLFGSNVIVAPSYATFSSRLSVPLAANLNFHAEVGLQSAAIYGLGAWINVGLGFDFFVFR